MLSPTRCLGVLCVGGWRWPFGLPPVASRTASFSRTHSPIFGAVSMMSTQRSPHTTAHRGLRRPTRGVVPVQAELDGDREADAYSPTDGLARVGDLLVRLEHCRFIDPDPGGPSEGVGVFHVHAAVVSPE